MHMDMTEAELRSASDQFYERLADVLVGDATSMLELWSESDDISYLGPGGEYLVGRAAIEQTWRDQAANKFGGSASPQENHFVVAGPLGVVVGYERGIVMLDGQEQDLEIRATSTYRKEDDGTVRMIGHHTDRF